MKSIEMSRFNRPLSLWGKLAAAGLLTAALVGCGGGSDGAAGATGATGPAGPAGSAGAAGTPGKDATAKVDANLMVASDWAAAKFKGEVTGVTSLSPLTVNFKLSDSVTGYPVVGLSKNTSKTATALKAGYVNLAFSVAKLVPATTDKPSSWVSYIVTTMPTTTTAAAPSRPSTDNTGTMTEDGAGGYTYTFYRDVTTIKAAVDAMTVTGVNNKAALGDLTWDPKLQHRVVVQLGGAARGTGSNTENGATVTPSVNTMNPVNLVYDFVPETKAAVPAANMMRDVVSIESCNSCHEKLAIHGGNRVEAKYCVVCHNDQRKYGYANVASVNGAFPALTETKTVNTVTGITSYRYAPATNLADGEVVGDFTTMVHKIHNGKELVKENYNYANVVFNNKGYSMLGGGQKMCSTCHDSTKAVNAANWATKPSRVACGSCHDGINFATGGGSTLADKAAATAVGSVMASSGHSPAFLAQTNDALCSTCHKEADIKAYHYTENKTKHNPVIEAGLKTFTYEIKSATVNATTNDVTIEFGIKADDQPVTFVAPAASVANPLAGFTGSPSFLLAYAMPQDGITTPADYNNAGRPLAQPFSVSIASLLSTNSAANGSVKPSATAGYYTATILGTGANKFPVGATMRAVALQGYFTQIVEKAGFPTRLVGRHAISVVKAVTGDAVRRPVVDNAKCSNCHEWFEGHGGNRVYETQVCVTCHVPGLATSGRGIPDATIAAFAFNKAQVKLLADWKFDKTAANAALALPVAPNNFKDMIHGIHAGRERVTPFMDARDSTSRGAIDLLDFRRMDFPGKLNNCQTCHVSVANSANNTYNFVPANTLPSTYESINAAYSATPTTANAKASLATASATDKVVTPYTAACVSCHDRADAQAHMKLNGGLINSTRASAVGVVESCATCHGPGKTYDTSVAHQ